MKLQNNSLSPVDRRIQERDHVLKKIRGHRLTQETDHLQKKPREHRRLACDSFPHTGKTRQTQGLLNTLTILLSTLLLALTSAHAAPEIGQPAPDFTVSDSNGKTHHLADYKGKFVVLEWLNHGCPFVAKHYNSGNMQSLQKKYTDAGVVWLSIISSKPGSQGHETPDEANQSKVQKKSAASAILLDEDGTVGRLYAAKVTPHMFIINPQGTLIYAGGIDDKKSTDIADIDAAKNYVAQALDEALAGNAVTKPTFQPYGCSVKY